MRLLFVLLCSTFFLFSCEEKIEGSEEMSSYLRQSFEFNNRILNKYKAEYCQLTESQPSREIVRLNELDAKFKSLIIKIDEAILNDAYNLKNITSESKEIFNELPKIVDNRKDYLLNQLIEPKNNSHELRLRYLKNRLVIAMAYAFEYGSRKTLSVDSFYKVEIDSIISRKIENGIKLTFTSEYGQAIKENRHIIINQMELNGQQKMIDYKLKDNYSFADIEFQSLQKGTYEIDGALRFYGRDGEIDIPFHKTMEVK
ncbi:hypothetical protein BST92_08630 [Nonlabens arenilitoris]|uniref:Uncharacterized protein n=1 Tax=Nonlabens arenilitoris TaxID=1217969 RepID=A0A2S7UC42_9FLAO|nr:hypothetical protein [Nonlabens arenilitoris]PQJ31984.1 hypothetical protein BST92_08630 [Nonlabens arenilitoris]